MLRPRLSVAALLSATAATLALAGCTVGPDYRKPPVSTPAAFKEAAGWKIGQPNDAAERGPWWSIYNDPVLDALEKQVEVANQTLKADEAAYRQARAIVAEARAGYWPTVTAGGSFTRSGGGGGRAGGAAGASSGVGPINEYDLNLASATWELDVWGRIRRTVESNVASAQASAGDLAAARLSAQTTLASDYFSLRISDELQRLLDSTVDAFQKSLQITRNRYAAGVAARTDVVDAQAQLETTRSQAIAVGIQRAQFEHAIAVLIGKAPADFAIAPVRLQTAVPEIPPGLPSALLERRPDIAAAERRMAAANAEIGVAIAAYYPDLTLSASYGFASTALSTLLKSASQIWALGPALSGTLIDGGLRSAEVAAARAGYDQTIANYRQTVLTGFQQVEDQLATLRILMQQAKVEEVAVRDAEEAERLTLNQYKAGTVAYTSVITAQTAALSNEQSALGILQNRLTASVTLIGALGGGWNAGQLPTEDQVEHGAKPERTSGK